MKKRISFTASLDIDSKDYDEEDNLPETFEEAEDCDYDSIGRPLNNLKDEGWVISNKKIEMIKQKEPNKYEAKVIKAFENKNLIGFYINPEVFSNYIYFDRRYSDIEGFYFTRLYKNEHGDIICNYEIDYGETETDDFVDCFQKYELEQILEMVNQELKGKDLKDELEYQNEHPDYWLKDE